MTEEREEELPVTKRAIISTVAALILLGAQPGLTQAPGDDLGAARKEIEALKKGQAAIQKDLQEIKNLLRARPVVPPAEPRDIVLSVGDAPFKGEKTAKLTLIDFSDYQ